HGDDARERRHHARGRDVLTDELTYPSYLKLDALLALQQPRSAPEHPDELLFIIVHQSSELWFKLIVHELERLTDAMGRDDAWDSLESVQRVNGLMRIVTAQLHALDTLSPHHFAQFRMHLGTSSGAQSAQFRAIELISGLRDAGYLEYLRAHGPHEPPVERALARPTLAELFARMLAHRGLTAREVYASDAARDLRMLAEALLSYEQEFGMWRFLHVQLVERILGPGTPGTGGSLGAQALRDTLSNRFFPELWAVRAEFY
ncbi:MAG TPA: tryptophan 2,3-dioxygenase family protein, partial [Candidatus Elarobacter sp.]|nr:tryptophan 2,3-dioxygenase family protein [Candidatus Elarobacter sp.]